MLVCLTENTSDPFHLLRFPYFPDLVAATFIPPAWPSRRAMPLASDDAVALVRFINSTYALPSLVPPWNCASMNAAKALSHVA